MNTGRRLTVLLVALTLIGIPAAVLRIGCVGNSCRSDAAAVAAPAPFCSLPADVRTLITAGTYDGRSPDVIGVGGSTPVVTDGVAWPSEQPSGRTGSVDLEFMGRAVQGGRLPAGVSLDQVAPTLEPLLGFHRPHPEVRAGTAIPHVVRPGTSTPLVVLIVEKGVGWSGGPRRLMHLLHSSRGGGSGNGVTKTVNPWTPLAPGVRYMDGRATSGSVPNDPIAVEATIGTGGLPSQHGITGALIRNENGEVVRAFGPGSPQPVIATLGDDLDRATGGATKIGLVSTAVGDAGLTGDAWYGTGPIRDRTVSGANPTVAVRGFLSRGWGADGTPDLLAVSLDGSLPDDGNTVASMTSEVFRAVPGATVVVAETGSAPGGGTASVPIPPGSDAMIAGGVFLDRSDGTTTSAQDVVASLKADQAPDGSPLFADAFASYAVRFGRYC